MYCYGYYTSCAHNGQHPAHRLFSCLSSLCLKTIAASPQFAQSAPSLRELDTTNNRHHWEDADTAGRLSRPPPDGLDRLLRGSLRSTAHLQWLSRSCCPLINDDRYGVAKQKKIKINLVVRLTGSDQTVETSAALRFLVGKHPSASQLFYFNQFTCFERPTNVGPAKQPVMFMPGV